MKYLKLYKLQKDYDNDVKNTLQISYIQEIDKVCRKNDKNYFIAKYNVTSITEPIALFIDWNQNQVENVIIDGEKQDLDKIRFVWNETHHAYYFKFSEVGEHSIKVYFNKNFNTCEMMFQAIELVKEIDLSNLHTDKILSMRSMFAFCDSLVRIKFSNNFGENCIDMGSMFYQCSGLTSLDLSNFDTSNVTGMGAMFQNCSGLTSLDLSNFDTSNVTSMGAMFNGCSSLNSLDLSNFDTSNVTDMRYMFDGCSSLTSLDLSNFNTSKVTDMIQMFHNCQSLQTLTLNLNNIEVIGHLGLNNMLSSYSRNGLTIYHDSKSDLIYYMALNCTSNYHNITFIPSLKITKDVEYYIDFTINPNKINIDEEYTLGHLGSVCGCVVKKIIDGYIYDPSYLSFYFRDIHNSQISLGICKDIVLKSCERMFASSLYQTIDVTNLNTSQVENIRYMFEGSEIESIDQVIGFETLNLSKVKYAGNIFSYCGNLTTIDLSDINLPSLESMDYAFAMCGKLQSVILPLNMDKCEYLNGMFKGCSNLTEVRMMFNPMSVKLYYGMFEGITTSGNFYYNSSYDYSKIIEVLPSTWTAVPIDYENGETVPTV